MDKLSQNIMVLINHQDSLGILVVVFFFILSRFYFRKIHFTTRMLVNVALMLAMAVILHQLRLYRMPQGGSITCGSMLPLLLISYCYGPWVGCLGGFIYGFFNIIQDPYLLHPIQVLFDYPLPYMGLGLAALWPAHRYASTLLAFTVRFACHIISGVVFFASYAPAGTSPLIYSLIFNASYLVPECVICFILLKILPIDRFLEAMDSKSEARITRNN